MRSKDRRKGFQCTGANLLRSYGSQATRIYHVYDVRGRLRLCDCDREGALHARLGIRIIGYRQIKHEHTRNSDILLELKWGV